MRVGYKRTSTGDQVAAYEAQDRDLREAKCERIFGEQLSSVDADRPQLEAVLDFVREGDVLVVTKLDRLARSVVDALTIEKRIKAKGATLQILDPQKGIVTTKSNRQRQSKIGKRSWLNLLLRYGRVRRDDAS